MIYKHQEERGERQGENIQLAVNKLCHPIEHSDLAFML